MPLINSMPESALFQNEYMRFEYRPCNWQGMADMILGTERKMFKEMVSHYNSKKDKPKSHNSDKFSR